MKISHLLLLSIFSFVFSGCATHYQKTIAIQDTFLRGDLAQADTLLTRSQAAYSDKDILLYYLDRGMVSHLRGKYEESNQFFERALERIDELYAKSISREAMTYMINDLAHPYRGEDFEQVMIHYYMALNYLMLTDLDGALVEARRVNLKLGELNEKYETKNRYKSDAFVLYLMGMIYEAEGDINDAFIAYRNAYETYQSDYQTFYALPAPTQLKKDLLRTSKALGFQTEYDTYASAFPNLTYIPQERYAENGEIILIWDNGMVPYKGQDVVNLRIEDKIDDQITVAFPYYIKRPPRTQSARLSVGGKSVYTEKVQDVADIAVKNLEDRRLRITAKAVTRATLKYGIQKQIEKEYGETAGCLFNIFSVATEAADTRSWLTLPDNIQVARLLVPPGTYTVTLDIMGSSGFTIEQFQYTGVRVEAGQKRFLRYRTFR